MAMLPLLVFFSCSKGGGKDQHFGITSSTTISLTADDTYAEIDIKSNVDWAITGGVAWCMPDVIRGNGDRKVKLKIQPKTTSGSREVTLTVGSFLGTVDIYVEQSGPEMGYAEGAYKAAETNRQTDPVNIVIMGDGFTAADMARGGAYDQAMDRAREAFFDIEPFKSYRNYFNVYYVYAESEDRGATYGWGYDMVRPKLLSRLPSAKRLSAPNFPNWQILRLLPAITRKCSIMPVKYPPLKKEPISC